MAQVYFLPHFSIMYVPFTHHLHNPPTLAPYLGLRPSKLLGSAEDLTEVSINLVVNETIGKAGEILQQLAQAFLCI